MLKELPMSNPSPPDYVAITSAVVGILSALMAWLSYRATVKQNRITHYNNTVIKCRNTLDQCYSATNKFCSDYLSSEHSQEKCMARDGVMYLLEALREDFPIGIDGNAEFSQQYEELDMKISDITYENDLDIVTKNLAVIRNMITSVKKHIKPKEF